MMLSIAILLGIAFILDILNKDGEDVNLLISAALVISLWNLSLVLAIIVIVIVALIGLIKLM